MKLFSLIVLVVAITALFALDTRAQKKVFILVRHAEKDAAQDEMSGDPELSATGKQRAMDLVRAIKRYRPGAVYSTDTVRTRSTVQPMAEHRHLKIEIYDARKQDELVKQLLASRTKRFLVVGHSNTIPQLANLLIQKELFQSLDDGEYGTIWIIRFRDGKFRKMEVLKY